jgi:dienelactone hydrolase
VQQQPRLDFGSKPKTVAAVVLVAHGGGVVGTDPPSRLSPAALRMVPFVAAIAGHPAAKELLIARLRYRVRGYNDGDPVADAQWALDELARLHHAPVVLLGHSMGARAVLRAAGHASVIAVAALGPWCPPGEPLDQLAGRTVMLAQGMRDRITVPPSSRAYAVNARDDGLNLCRFEVADSGHTMLRRARFWHRLTRNFILGMHGLIPVDERFSNAFSLPSARAVAVPL